MNNQAVPPFALLFFSIPNQVLPLIFFFQVFEVQVVGYRWSSVS